MIGIPGAVHCIFLACPLYAQTHKDAQYVTGYRGGHEVQVTYLYVKAIENTAYHGLQT